MANILPFQRTNQLVGEIDEFLDKAVDGALIAERAVLHYLEHGADGALDERVEEVMAAESRGTELRRSIANAMYAEMLMPDARGDILSLLGALDEIINKLEETLWYFSSEQPEIPEHLKGGKPVESAKFAGAKTQPNQKVKLRIP